MSTHNSLYGNGSYTGTYNGKQVYNLNSTFVKAKYNYWGGTPVSGMFYGNVSYSPYLASNPLSLEPIGSDPITSNNGSLFKSNDGSVSDVDLKEDKIEENKQFIAENPESPESVPALDEIYHLVRGDYNNELKEKDSIYDYLNGLYIDYPHLDVGKRALELMVNERMRAHDMKNAILHAEEGVKVLEGEANKSMMATLTLFYIQQDRLTDAEKLFAEFKNIYGKDKNLVEFLLESIENAPQNILCKPVDKEIMLQKDATKPSQFMLFQNYPNPFNPATTINYELQEDSFVNISIYNIQGKLITKLVDEKKSAGSHKVIWNAGNLSSGVYIYKIEAGGFRAVRKLMLLK